MSKNRQHKPASGTPPEKPAVTPQVVAPTVEITEPAKTPTGQQLKAHRMCPLCWERCKGYGTAYSTAPNGRSYYKCNQTLTEHPPCGHTWSVLVSLQSVTIEHRTIEMDGMR